MATDEEQSGKRATELVLPAGEQAFVIDRSKGTVSVVVGPHQKSLTASSEEPIKLDSRTDRLVRCSIAESCMRFPTAKQGQYIILENPAPDDRKPGIGAITAQIDLNMGHRVIIPGPTSFPLWPMQRASVVDAHILRTDQYLVVVIYDETNAEKNKGQGFTRRAKLSAGEKVSEILEDYQTTLGHRFIVKGTEVSCYIPPTGYEVVPETIEGRPAYVRTAVSLERLEYCTLLDENGGRRIEEGPMVVFPSPTETFVTEANDGFRTAKFRAIELDETKGIYVKVTEDYTGNDGKEFRRGDELFITGAEQRIYFPRPEHSIIRYGDSTMHYGIAIPLGQGRYVLDRQKGEITLVKGPCEFLPNPIKQVIARRILTQKEVQLLYPNNNEVAEANRAFRSKSSGERHLLASHSSPDGAEAFTRGLTSETVGGGASSFNRGTEYSPPRSVVLDGKFDGAVKVEVWPGSAIMVVRGDGTRRVVVGPNSTLLEYDEMLHRFSLSTGTPKTDTNLFEGVYLQVTANTVSDRVEVETADLCHVELTVSYRVNFEGSNNERWFNVSNYVALLTSTLRSVLRKAAKQHGINTFLEKAADIVRDVVLGKAVPEGTRAGKKFEENGMRVYDMDVLRVMVCDREIKNLIDENQMSVFQHDYNLGEIERGQETALATASAQKEALSTRLEIINLELATERHRAEKTAEIKALSEGLEQSRKEAEALSGQKLAEISKAIQTAEAELIQLQEESRIENLRKETAIEVEAYEKRLAAMGEELPKAIVHMGNTALMGQLTENLSVQHLLGGGSVVEIFQKALGGTPLMATIGKFLTPQSKD
ncbi:MAG: hypothetical protein WCQ00_01270 [bacterium]